MKNVRLLFNIFLSTFFTMSLWGNSAFVNGDTISIEHSCFSVKGYDHLADNDIISDLDGNICEEIYEKFSLDLKANDNLFSALDKIDNGGGDGIKAWEGLINIKNLRTNIDWLTRSSKWIDEGAEFVTTNGVTKLRKGADDILEIKNEKILPSKYDYNTSTGTYNSGGTPIGEASNGYQVYKHGNDLSVRRVPETGDYTQGGYLTKLTEHPQAHVLERHGHDVTDDALIKRAKDGIAPDGSYIGNASNPFKPFSSKFGDSDKVKLAFDKTNPTSPAWASRTQNQYGGWDVVYEDPNIIFGKGIAPPGTGAFENLTKVKASYAEVSPGVFQIVTMFPIK